MHMVPGFDGQHIRLRGVSSHAAAGALFRAGAGADLRRRGRHPHETADGRSGPDSPAGAASRWLPATILRCGFICGSASCRSGPSRYPPRWSGERRHLDPKSADRGHFPRPWTSIAQPFGRPPTGLSLVYHRPIGLVWLCPRDRFLLPQQRWHDAPLPRAALHKKVALGVPPVFHSINARGRTLQHD